MKTKYTLLTANKPKCVTKKYRLDADGNLTPETSANVAEGRLNLIEVESAIEFASNLKTLGFDQCHIYGVPPHDAKLLTEAKWEEMGRPKHSLPRTQSIFDWPIGAGVMLLDRDAPKDGCPALSREQLFEVLSAVCPEFEAVDSVWWPSSSSHICRGTNDLTGLRGQHLYLFVTNASDIARAGEALNVRLWAMGYGHFTVSTSGTLLKKDFFDGSVWQSNHIDFAAGAKCGPGLSQQRGDPYVRGGVQFVLLDTLRAIPEPTSQERALAAANQEKSRRSLEPEAKKIRAEWEASRVKSITLAAPGVNATLLASVIPRALERKELVGPFQVTVITANRKEVTLSITELLDDPDRYDGLLTLDPIEPDYDGRRVVGKLFLKSVQPNLHSFARGGANYKLKRDIPRVRLVPGKTHQAVDALLEKMREAPDLFDFGPRLVQIGSRCSLLQLTDNTLGYVAAGLVQFYSVRYPPNGPPTDVLEDPPIAVCRTVGDLKENRRLKKLTGLITAPTLRPDGSLMVSSGYDRTTGLFLDIPVARPNIPINPSLEQARQALDFIWRPFKDFPFCSPLDRAVHLAAVLTTAVRAVLPAAPAFAYDAPIQGSGKTLLARCVGGCAQDTEPGVWPHTSGSNDEEIRKRIFTVLLSGARILIWDNVVGVFDSAAVAACLTSASYSDRVLGKSESITVPNRMMLVLTGNNLVLKGEMPRRVLISRIDPETDRPFAREFELNPYTYCRDNRLAMNAAALTLIRAYLSIGCQQPIKGELASFEVWDAWVRRTVLFANELRPGMFGDVMDCITTNQADDPEQEELVALLAAWHSAFGSDCVHAMTVLNKATSILDDKENALREAINGLPLRDGYRVSAKSFGRYLSFRKDRIVGGYRLRAGPMHDDKKTWRVEKVAAG